MLGRQKESIRLFSLAKGQECKGASAGLGNKCGIKPSERLDRWLSYKDHLFLLQKSQVQIPALTPQLTTSVTLVPGG